MSFQGYYSVHRDIDGIGLAVLDVTQTGPQELYINRILVPRKNRGQGIGTALMKEFIEKVPSGFAVLVHPTANYGSDVPRLEAFFMRFGFTHTDLYSEGMFYVKP